MSESSSQFTTDYSSYSKWKRWDNNSFARYSLWDDAYFRKELQECGIKDPDGLKCVEIGFGNGSFAAWSANQNINYSGIEIIEELVTEGKALGFNVDMSADNLQLNANSIDLVVAFDVFEHFTWDQLKEQLVIIHCWLKPGGLLVFRVPSGDSPFSRAMQHGDITHKITIGSSLIRQLALDNNFKIVAIKPPAFPIFHGSLIPVFRRFIVKTGQLIVTRIIQILFHHNQSTVISSNLVAVLKRV